MMAGGLFTLGFGLIAMVLVIGLPVALIVVLIWALTRRGNSSVPAPVPVHQNTASARTCSHCGVALQADWSHCPQCGAPV
ncbi:MAG: zinc-ribbon domain-containing protein [Anaerolineales bacterium]